MKTISTKTLESMHVTKGELFASVKNTFDYAIPQDWLNNFADYCETWNKNITYDLIRSTVVWEYPKDSIFGRPLFACTEVKKAYIKMLFYKEYHKTGIESPLGMRAILSEYFELTHGNNKHYRALEDFINRLEHNLDLQENGMFLGMITDAFRKLLDEL